MVMATYQFKGGSKDGESIEAREMMLGDIYRTTGRSPKARETYLPVHIMPRLGGIMIEEYACVRPGVLRFWRFAWA